MEDPSNSYFTEILKKFDFINYVWVTDFEGGLIISSMKNEEKKESEDESERNNKLKFSLSFLFNSAMDQISKIEKWKTKNIVSFYDTVTVFQSRINKNILAHFICNTKGFNYEIMKEIVSEITEKLQKIEKEIDSLTQSNDNI
jgi:hypothetical protein